MAEAKNYADYRRNILPKSYRENASNRKKKPNNSNIIVETNSNVAITENAEKLALQKEVQEKIMAMHDQFVDLNDSDIDEFQALLYEDNDSDDTSFEWADENDEIPIPMHIVKMLLRLVKF